jgi:hypothetical protein
LLERIAAPVEWSLTFLSQRLILDLVLFWIAPNRNWLVEFSPWITVPIKHTNISWHLAFSGWLWLWHSIFSVVSGNASSTLLHSAASEHSDWHEVSLGNTLWEADEADIILNLLLKILLSGFLLCSLNIHSITWSALIFLWLSLNLLSGCLSLHFLLSLKLSFSLCLDFSPGLLLLVLLNSLNFSLILAQSSILRGADIRDHAAELLKLRE